MSPTIVGEPRASAARGADERALGEIFSRYHQQLYRYCLAILGDPQDAEEALQNTMMKALRALPGEQREIALKPWLYRIAHNESIDLIRRRRPNVPLEESEPAVGSALAEQVETRHRLRQLIADVGALPERQRGALLMREAGGLEFEEIAAALGTTPAVARQTLYEARLGLREMDAGRAMECTAVTIALSDRDGRVRRRRDIRAHLRDCADCRRFAEEIDSRRRALAAISPLPAVAAAAMLRGLGGGGTGAAAVGTAGGGGLGGAAGAGVAKSVGAATLVKGAATLAVAAAIGVGGADVGDLLHPGTHGQGRSTQGRSGAVPDPLRERGAQTARGPAQGPASVRAVPGAPSKARLAGAKRARRSPRSGRISAPKPAAAAPVSPAAPASPAESPPVATAAAGGDGSSNRSEAEHPHGPGHDKQTPASAAHGQETAAADNAKPKPGSGAGSAGAAGEPAATTTPVTEHPVHPVHPAKPEAAAIPTEAPPVEDEEPDAEPPGQAKEKKS